MEIQLQGNTRSGNVTDKIQEADIQINTWKYKEMQVDTRNYNYKEIQGVEM